MLEKIRAAGFNTVRLPYSNQLLDATIKPGNINFGLNPNLKGLNGLGVLDYVVNGASRRGLRVILDRHRPSRRFQGAGRRHTARDQAGR